jgi:6-phosphogluconate dehydrogenase
MASRLYTIGTVGLGVMGRNFVLNLTDHDHTVVGYDKDQTKGELLQREAPQGRADGLEPLPWPVTTILLVAEKR